MRPLTGGVRTILIVFSGTSSYGRSTGAEIVESFHTCGLCWPVSTRVLILNGPRVMDGLTTIILQRLSAGEDGAFDELVPRVYEELKQIARLRVAHENPGAIQPTELVHEAYLRLIDQHSANWLDRSHFLATASNVMRRILIDQARSRGTAKRGGNHSRIHLESLDGLGFDDEAVDLLLVDELLNGLERLNARHAKVVEMRIFGGLMVREVAEVLGTSEATVKNDFRCARAWLAAEMNSVANKYL